MNIKNLQFLVCVITSAFIDSAHAQSVLWNVEGNWNLAYYVQDGLNNLPMTITSEDFNTGSFTGNDVYGNQIAGTVTGSGIQFDDIWWLSFNGSIATDGTMSGYLADNNGHGIWSGSFWTIAGQAALEVPEPSSLAIIGIGLACIANLRRVKLL
ncbi:MAG: PEP-CTERM sorting domain-containing protein [Verrucomicrobiota bacterium]|jgi:hypothetical protein